MQGGSHRMVETSISKQIIKMNRFKYNFMKRVLLFSLLILGSKSVSFGCSTPVFRYALEMWSAYSYIIEITHNGNLNSSQNQAMNMLKNASSSSISANLKVIEKIESGHGDEATIKMAFPEEHKIPGVLWSGALTKKNVEKIINSPSRNAALEKIQLGDAAVWLFLESGNEIRDDKQYDLLKNELVRLSKELKLSETATDVAGNLLDIKVVNTGVNFSLVRIDRDDPMEEVFIQMLLGTESDLRFFENVPLAFPMFGQGRVLYALAGNGIKSKNIETACSTIIGWCSCTIKDDNPGTDLLIAADWESFIGDSSWIIPVEVPEITGLASFMTEEEDVTEIKEEKIKSPDSEAPIPEIKTEERLVAAMDESPAPLEEDEIALEPVVVNNEVLNSSVVESHQEEGISPLLRNSMIAFALIIVVITTTLFIMKKR